MQRHLCFCKTQSLAKYLHSKSILISKELCLRGNTRNVLRIKIFWKAQQSMVGVRRVTWTIEWRHRASVPWHRASSCASVLLTISWQQRPTRGAARQSWTSEGIKWQCCDIWVPGPRMWGQWGHAATVGVAGAGVGGGQPDRCRSPGRRDHNHRVAIVTLLVAWPRPFPLWWQKLQLWWGRSFVLSQLTFWLQRINKLERERSLEGRAFSRLPCYVFYICPLTFFMTFFGDFFCVFGDFFYFLVKFLESHGLSGRKTKSSRPDELLDF